MSSKFVTAPDMISQVGSTLSQYGVRADVSEIGMAMILGLVAFGVARSVLSAA